MKWTNTIIIGFGVDSLRLSSAIAPYSANTATDDSENGDRRIMVGDVRLSSEEEGLCPKRNYLKLADFHALYLNWLLTNITSIGRIK